MRTDTRTLGEMRDALFEKASADTEFRSRLLADPKTAVKEEFGIDMPEGFALEVHEQTPNAVHLVLPPSDVLDETELNQVSGGLLDVCIDIPPVSEWGW